MPDKIHTTWLRVFSANTNKYCDIAIDDTQARLLQRVFEDPILADKSWQQEDGSWIDNMLNDLATDPLKEHNVQAMCFVLPPERGHKPFEKKK